MRIESITHFTHSVKSGTKLLVFILVTIMQSACGGGAAAISGAGQAIIFIDNVANIISAADKFALDQLEKEGYETIIKNLPGDWKGVSYASIRDVTNTQEVVASFRRHENKIFGSISISPCLPTTKLTTTFDGKALLIDGNEGGRSFHAYIPILNPGVTESKLTLWGIRYTSNIRGCSSKNSNAQIAYLNRQ